MTPTEAVVDGGEKFVNLDADKAIVDEAGKIPVFVSNDKYDKYDNAPPTTEQHAGPCKIPTPQRATDDTYKIPVFTTEDKYAAPEPTIPQHGTMAEEIAALKEEISFLQFYNKAQGVLLGSEIASLKATLDTTLQNIKLLEENHIAPFQAAVTELEAENKVLRWLQNDLLLRMRQREDAVADAATDAALGAAASNDDGES